MIKKLETITILFILLLAFSLLITDCSKFGKEDSGREMKKEAAQPSGQMRFGGKDARQMMRVETAAASIKPIVLEKQYIGEIKPFYSVDLKSAASGWLKNINVDTGDYVGKNDIIGVIEHDDIQAQAEQAKANILVAKASVARAEAELERAQSESKRNKSLYEKGYVSKQDMEQAQTTEKQASASLDSAQGQLALSEAQLKNIMVKLRDTTIKAPFSGIVAERYVDPGAYVSPANPVVRLEDASKVEAVINVVEEDFARLHKGAKAKILIDSYSGQEFKGEIIRIAPSIDKVSRTAEVEIIISNWNGKLKSGMTARVSLVIAKKTSALVIPETALRRDVEAGINYVFTLVEGTTSRRNVETGIISAGEVEIIHGLNPGDSVITGDVRLSEGMKMGAPNRGQRGRRKGGSR